MTMPTIPANTVHKTPKTNPKEAAANGVIFYLPAQVITAMTNKQAMPRLMVSQMVKSSTSLIFFFQEFVSVGEGFKAPGDGAQEDSIGVGFEEFGAGSLLIGPFASAEVVEVVTFAGKVPEVFRAGHFYPPFK